MNWKKNGASLIPTHLIGIGSQPHKGAAFLRTEEVRLSLVTSPWAAEWVQTISQIGKVVKSIMGGGEDLGEKSWCFWAAAINQHEHSLASYAFLPVAGIGVTATLRGSLPSSHCLHTCWFNKVVYFPCSPSSSLLQPQTEPISTFIGKQECWKELYLIGN